MGQKTVVCNECGNVLEYAEEFQFCDIQNIQCENCTCKNWSIETVDAEEE